MNTLPDANRLGRARVFYLGLEPLNARYTKLLSEDWMPPTFDEHKDKIQFVNVTGDAVSSEIKVGAVLDATGRGIYAMSQCTKLLKYVEDGEVHMGDVIFLQDFWTPGLDAVMYALQLYGVRVRVYSMLHAQSVDEFDFTHNMLPWIRHYELGIDANMSGIFVASTVHKEQLRRAGFRAPIHVVSLPFNSLAASSLLPNPMPAKEKTVIYCSRLSDEKNPLMMLETAVRFLDANPDWCWKVTTSGSGFAGSTSTINIAKSLVKMQPRFEMLAGLSKTEYYEQLCRASIYFNSSWQDYVSWTLIEAAFCGCDVVVPDYRSFPEAVETASRRYDVNSVESAFRVLTEVQKIAVTHKQIAVTADFGRQVVGNIITNNIVKEINVWQDEDIDIPYTPGEFYYGRDR